jgi:NADH:ubiquinone oxidoreductase subunit F (NADH-binding)/(2Fe-2S) ferredoxin
MNMMDDRRLTEYNHIPDHASGALTLNAVNESAADQPDQLIEILKEKLSAHGQDDVQIKISGGMGFFSAERLLKVNRVGLPAIIYRGVTPDMAEEIILKHLVEKKPVAGAALCQIASDKDAIENIPNMDDVAFFKKQNRQLTWRCGHIDPERIDEAFRTGSYETLKAVLQQDPSAVRARIASLCPDFGEKIQSAARQGENPVLVCNALEVETDSVKDRWLMEADPHRLLEGLVIAARASGARIGYIAFNQNYTTARRRLDIAMAQARRHRQLGRNIRGAGVDFDLITRIGPQNYILGEDTALIAFLEGGAGPRCEPPYPHTGGLNGRPTLVADPETFARLCALSYDDAVESSEPARLYTLHGTPQTGVVEVEPRCTARDLICEMGAVSEEAIRAVVIGGHLGGLLPADLLDSPMNEETFHWLGIAPGNGLLSVIDRSTPIIGWMRDHARFAARESCGACAPCREGTIQSRHLMEKMSGGNARAQDVALLEQLAGYISGASMCGFGRMVPGGIQTALRHFGREIRDQISKGHP